MLFPCRIIVVGLLALFGASVYAIEDSENIYSYAVCYEQSGLSDCASARASFVQPDATGQVADGDAMADTDSAGYAGIMRISEKGACQPESLKPSAPIVLGSNDNGRVIEGVKISNPDGYCIRIDKAKNITIKGSLFENCKTAIFATESSDIRVEGNRFDNSGAVMKFWFSQGGIKVRYNEYRNIGVQRPVRGTANFVQLNDVRGDGIDIIYNVGECYLSEGCGTEDLVSVYKSEGTREDPIRIANNEFRGRGPSDSGSGVMTGDFGGGFIVVKDNVFVNPGQVGIGIAGGHDIAIVDNMLYHSDSLSLVSGTAILVGNWGQGSPCFNHKIEGNKSNWYSSRGKVFSSWWPYGQDYDRECALGVVSLDSNSPPLSLDRITGADQSISETILPNDLFSGLPEQYFSSCR